MIKKKMNIVISFGHNVYNGGVFDRGSSSGKYVEADIVKATVRPILIDLLKKQGHNVFDITPDGKHFKNSREAHQYRANKVNALHKKHGVDIYLDLHTNAGGGNGTECLISGRSKLSEYVGAMICRNISTAIGRNNRGNKIRPNYWSIKMVEPPAVIVEGAFTDNPIDMERFSPELYAIEVARVFGEVDIKEEEVKYKVEEKNIMIDGVKHSVRQITQDGEMFVSIRPLAEKLGMGVGWDKSERVASLDMSDLNLKVNGKKEFARGIKINGTNYAELRKIAELLGKDVNWVQSEKLIEID